MHLAAKTNDLYQTGKKIAGMFMPALDRHGMTGAAAAIGQGFGPWTRCATAASSGTRT